MSGKAPAVVLHDLVEDAGMLAPGSAGIDAGLTLTKIARQTPRGIELAACLTSAALDRDARVSDIGGAATRVGVTGARGDRIADGASAVRVQEIEAAAHGAIALMGADAPAEFALALLGTGTAFARVRDGAVQHLGGTALGGGSFAAIARLMAPSLSYQDVIENAARGDRRNADLMVSDAYPDGIGRISADLTAAHLAKTGGRLEDALAALLNLHGENIGQIAAGRALVGGITRIVLAGGFAHQNGALVSSIADMARLFGLNVDVAPHAGFAGAVGAALMAEST
jgi:hypothetical protein